MATAAVKIAPGVWRIPTAGRSMINSFAFENEDGSVALVDTGLAKAPPRIVAGLAAMGRAPSDVTRIVLTHAHNDHAGSAAEMAKLTGATLTAHARDSLSIETGQSPIGDPSLTWGRLLNRMGPPEFAPFEVGNRVGDGDLLPIGGGLRVVHTPGHSPGHISLLHEPTRTLITGDALFNVLGIRWPVAAFCHDFRMTKRTAHVLGELEYDRVAFTHGPEITDRARERVRRFLAKHRPA